MNEIKTETHPFEPFIPKNARILILGTFPPKEERWSMKFFYPNKINDMWRIMGIIFYNDKVCFWDETHKKFILDKIKGFLTEQGIALYDTGYKVKRLKDNASDKFLEIVSPSDIKGILTDNATITTIITAGEKATETLASMFGTSIPSIGNCVKIKFNNRIISHYRAPSSSRAYPLSIEKKAEAYASIFIDAGYDLSKKNT